MWGEDGYGYIQRGQGQCGVNSIEMYSYYGVGGIAYVNGTGFTNDDALNIEEKIPWLQKILAWPHLTLLLSILVAVMSIPLIVAFINWARGLHRQRRSSVAPPNTVAAIPPATLAVYPLPPPQQQHRPAALYYPRPRGGGVLSPIHRGWSCPACTFFNHGGMSYCEVCAHPRAMALLDPESSTSTTDPSRALL